MNQRNNFFSSYPAINQCEEKGISEYLEDNTWCGCHDDDDYDDDGNPLPGFHFTCAAGYLYPSKEEGMNEKLQVKKLPNGLVVPARRCNKGKEFNFFSLILKKKFCLILSY